MSDNPQNLSEPPKSPQDAAPALPVKTFRFSPKIILTDYILRWALVSLLRLHFINSWVFWTLQVFVVSIVIFAVAMNVDSKLGAKYGVKTDVEFSPTAVFTIMFCIITGTLVSSSIVLQAVGGTAQMTAYSISMVVLASVAVLVCYGGFVCGLAACAITDAVPDLTKGSADSRDSEFDPSTIVSQSQIDQNDARIVNGQVALSSVRQRVDAYILESVLFGALAFTAFVQILTSGHPASVDIAAFFSTLSKIGNAAVVLHVKTIFVGIKDLDTPASLLSAILLETLVCAMFFLSVIASRLRCSDFIERSNYFVQLAQAYNKKEEDLQHITIGWNQEKNVVLKQRSADLEATITDLMDRSTRLQQEIVPIVAYMRAFRSLGVATFLLILITSALLISPTLAVIFAMLSLCALLYSNIDTWIRNKRFREIWFQKQKEPH